MAKAAEVPTLLGAPRVLGELFSELGEVCPVLELALDLLGLGLLVLVEEDVPGAALLGGGELSFLVLLVELLDLLLGGLGAPRHPLLHLLDGELIAQLPAQLLLGYAGLLEGLPEGLLAPHVHPLGLGLLGDLVLYSLDLLVHVAFRDRYAMLLCIGLGD